MTLRFIKRKTVSKRSANTAPTKIHRKAPDLQICSHQSLVTVTIGEEIKFDSPILDLAYVATVQGQGTDLGRHDNVHEVPDEITIGKGESWS